MNKKKKRKCVNPLPYYYYWQKLLIREK